jgi:nucleoid-associated protein YgaU
VHLIFICGKYPDREAAMTRETKISLLVGLAFFIVMGILLTDHLRMAGEPPQAALADAGATVREATGAPGQAEPPIRMAPAVDASPKQSVPTNDELTRPAPPVIPSNPEDHGADAPPQKSLADVARRNGERLVPSNIDGTPMNPDQSNAQPPAAPPVADASTGPRQYRAQPGDTVSRMAAKFFGVNSRANRQAIINANRSLQDDPDRVIVGQAYVIPAARQVAMSPPRPTLAPRTTGGEYYYTVQEGDSLWAIANDELGDPSAVDAIKELNQSVLKGKDTVIPGMKLRLPSKPVASANSSM